MIWDGKTNPVYTIYKRRGKRYKNMNYEELYTGLQSLEKTLKDKQSAALKQYKNAVKNTEAGDLKSLSKNLELLISVLGEQQSLAESIKQAVDGFAVKEYFENGDFAAQLLEFCATKEIDVKGEYPVYEMFPYKVKIDAENQDVYVDKKRIPCARPAELARQIKVGQDKLNNASFNAQSFLNELADAYDLAIIKGNKVPASDQYLLDLYKLMVPMARSRKEYDLQSFAFDLARLHGSDIKAAKDGRLYQFGPGRKVNKKVRILDKNGQEIFLFTIRFYEA